MSTNSVNASIITIGDELLIGQTIDTNSAFIAQELNKIGVWVRRRVAVGDVYDDIWKALDEESKQADIIIITGGLGPTADDITKPLLCKYFGGKLVVNEKVLEHVKYLFEVVFRRPPPILDRNLKQAEVPDVCTVLHNARGTAPGMWFSPPAGGGGAVFISLPGVPHEMKGLMIDEVIPRLLSAFKMPAIVHRTAFTFGQGESMLAELLKDFESSLPSHIKLAYLPNYGMVKLRLTSQGDNKEEIEKELAPYFEQLQELVKEFLVTNKDEGLEVVFGQLLKENGKLFIAVPNYTSKDAAIYKEYWAAYDVPRHLYHFSPRSMQVLMEKHGLKLIGYKPMWYDSFYISMLSSKYKNGKTNLVASFFNGLRSNLKTMGDVKRCSSVIYIASPNPSKEGL